jgi:hypothetical protein
MSEMAEKVPEVRLCGVANELEAAMVVDLLREEKVAARSDASPGMSVFGGLPFEPGHIIFVPASQAYKAREILAQYPHFKNLRNVHEPDV